MGTMIARLKVKDYDTWRAGIRLGPMAPRGIWHLQ